MLQFRRRQLRTRADGCLVIDCAVQQLVAGVVGDLDQDAQLRKVGQDFGHSGCERRVVNQGARSRIREQILQLAFDVAEVDIEGGNSRLEGTEQRLDEFVSVVRVEAQQVLAHLVAGQRGALGVAPQPLRVQIRGEMVRSLDRLGVAESLFTLDQQLPVTDRGRDGLGDGRYRELCCNCGHCSSQLVLPSRRRIARADVVQCDSASARATSVPLTAGGVTDGPSGRWLR